MISIVVFAIGIFAIIVYASPSDVTKDPQRIYLYYDYRDTSPKYVKVQDMAPNSVGYFTYPNSYNFSDSENAYQKFLLIRLPSWLGGDNNDISSYRAYSVLDLDSHCLIKYWPQYERQRIEDSCHFEMYRTIDGSSYFPGVKIMAKPVENALPQLDLGVDNAGYIYVKTPTWDVNKNGLIGDGRHLSKDQVLNSSRFMLEKYTSQSKINIPIPLFLEDGLFLIDMSYDTDKVYVRYAVDKPTTSTPSIDISYCNCTGLSSSDSNYYHMTKYAQAWQFGNHTVYSSADMYANDDGKSPYFYYFEFYQNGYHVIFNPMTSFDKGMKMTLDTFFNGTKLSDAEQVSLSNAISHHAIAMSTHVENTSFTINYTLTGDGRLFGSTMNIPAKSLVLSLESPSNGTLTVTIPRALVDAKYPTGKDDKYYVLIDGLESIFQEINATVNDRTISISFPNGTHVITIIGAQII